MFLRLAASEVCDAWRQLLPAGAGSEGAEELQLPEIITGSQVEPKPAGSNQSEQLEFYLNTSSSLTDGTRAGGA